jgi:hypothetical protein
MIPRTPILHGSPGIIETVPRSDGTLSQAIDAVHLHTQPLPNPVPMNTGAIALELVVDSDCDILSMLLVCYGKFQRNESKNTYITPTSLNPGPRVLSVKYFPFSKVQSVGVDPIISNVQDIFANGANWCLVAVFVVCANIVLNASLIIPQPTPSIVRVGAM